MIMNKIGTVQMQETGVHYMGANLKESVNDVETQNVDTNKIVERFLDLESSKDCANKSVKAVGYTVIFKPYKKNPYRQTTTTKSGLIVAGDLFAGSYKSQDSGEMEQAEQFIACGKAVSCGPDCKYISDGEDFYYRNTCVPIPFGGQGLYAISEGNIICRIIDNE